MKLKFLTVTFLGTVLLGCGGHEFEGKWNMKLESVISNDYSDIANKAMGQQQMILGDDYIEVSGKRTDVDIFTRESDGSNYLVMETESGQEDVFLIQDDNTLIQKMNAQTFLLFVRVE